MDLGEARDSGGRKSLESVPGIVLAAGASCRFGQNKLLMPLGGQTVLSHVVQTALEAPLEPVILVLGYESEKALAAIAKLKDSPKLRIVLNARWGQGRAESLKLALRALPPEAPGALVLLGDMPLMTHELIARVVRAFLDTQRVCFPIYRGSVGRPVALPKGLFPEFEELHGDESGLKILQKYWDDAVKLELGPAEEPTQWDIDDPKDMDRMLKEGRVSNLPLLSS
ncbi:MAG: nucleotidyltransferase family protein [Candidatus Bipolaricaulota bacterium]|nr:nucleotidyltransferase family protein [Candidatus Bipolaricaulota bacterium]